MSCGAIRVWNYLGARTDQEVAAVLLMAGDPGSAWTQAGCGIGRVAIWAFHGTDDRQVPFSSEQAVMQRLLACPAPPRRDVVFTAVQGAGHEVAWEAYEGSTGPDALNWLLAHAKP